MLIAAAIVLFLVGQVVFGIWVVRELRASRTRGRRVERQFRTGGTTPEQPEPVEAEALPPKQMARARVNVREQLKARYPHLTKAQYAAAENEIVVKGVRTLGRL